MDPPFLLIAFIVLDVFFRSTRKPALTEGLCRVIENCMMHGYLGDGKQSTTNYFL